MHNARLRTIAVGMGFVPRPSRLDDALDIGKLWTPSQGLANLRGAGNQDSGVSSAAWTLLHWNGMSRNPPRNLDDLADAETRTASEIEDQTRILFESAESK